ncbi:MAG: hypothetical protein M1838_003755 [Thelocarpon superellum]|nr:MAG: hypothetical protein M1838_003755 [Thelocarpon superellum]
MAPRDVKNPQNWDDYAHGASRSESPGGSPSSRISFARADSHVSLTPVDIPSRRDGQSPGIDGLRQRRSSISVRLDSIRHAGGVNSIDNFARSWQRAAGFVNITPRHQSFHISDESDHSPRRAFRGADEEHGSVFDSRSDDSASEGGSPHRRNPETANLLRVTPHLASEYGSSYGTTYGTIASRINDSSLREAARLYEEQQATGAQQPDQDREPLLVKRVELNDGKVVNVVVGQSTLPQTIFNSVNTLIGVGLLSLPLGFQYAGWLIATTFLLFSAVATQYTAGILAKCLDVDPSLITFADIAYVSFGARARIVTSVLFSIELIAACVALVVLFADSLDALIPGWGLTSWKVVCGVLLVPLGFLPLRVLSISSVLGIICCFGIVAILFMDGLIKPEAPGSLREPAATYLLPAQWSKLPLSFGLLMSPWGGHSVFPNIYRDMRHPHKYNRSLAITYSFTFLLDVSMAIVGWLMFGDDVKTEITSNVLVTKGYPKWLSIGVVIFIAIIPLTKVPLNARPIISTIELFAGLDARAVSNAQALVGMTGYTRGILKFTIRVLTTIMFVVIAILFPYFDRIMALLGSAMCFSICIILPLAFYLKIFGSDISWRERVLDYFLIVTCSLMAVVGTIWAFLPQDGLEITA